MKEDKITLIFKTYIQACIRTCMRKYFGTHSDIMTVLSKKQTNKVIQAGITSVVGKFLKYYRRHVYQSKSVCSTWEAPLTGNEIDKHCTHGISGVDKIYAWAFFITCIKRGNMNWKSSFHFDSSVSMNKNSTAFLVTRNKIVWRHYLFLRFKQPVNWEYNNIGHVFMLCTTPINGTKQHAIGE